MGMLRLGIHQYTHSCRCKESVAGRDEGIISGSRQTIPWEEVNIQQQEQLRLRSVCIIDHTTINKNNVKVLLAARPR